MAGTSKNTLKFFMYPRFVMGHLTQYLLTANKLAERGHKIFPIIPPKVQSKLGPLNLHPDLNEFRPISIPAVEGLPAHVETTNDVAIGGQQLLQQALDLTQPVIQSLLCDLKPDFIFFDLLYWLPGLARHLEIKSVHYSVVSPAAMVFLFVEDVVPGSPGFLPSIKLYKHAARGFMYFEWAKEMSSA